MRRKPFIVTLAATAALGTALTQAACHKEEPVRNPPAPEVEPPTENPPGPEVQLPPPEEVPTGPSLEKPDNYNPPRPVTLDPPPPTTPTWDEVESGHPEGATNPPIPVLAVTPDGRCFKEFFDPRRVPPEARENDGARRIADASETNGTEIYCPERADAVLKNEP
ncbi:MAG: hypothetical protein H6739_26725 [Alphaproteobacteria bacterium]|nr:hypothetical protein [Alphaproteobacteria bacterium]